MFVKHDKVHELPRRSEGLISSEFDGEFVIVDTNTEEAHSLSGEVAQVWRQVEGGPRPDLPQERIDEIVSGLVELGLLESGGVSRRTLLKVGAAGGVGVALAGVISTPLVSVASAASLSFTFPDASNGQTYYAEVPAGQTFNYTLNGGGGGGGEGAGSTGGRATQIYGTIKNNTGANRVLWFNVGFGAKGGNNGGAQGAGFGAGGNGNSGGGGGGGGTTISAGSNGETILVVAGGGAGGGKNANQPGPIGLTTSTSGTPNPAGYTGGFANGVNGGGGGGGGADSSTGTGATTVGNGGTNGNAGGAGGSYFPASVAYGSGSFVITANVVAAGGAPGGSGGVSSGTTSNGHDGSITISGGGITGYSTTYPNGAPF